MVPGAYFVDLVAAGKASDGEPFQRYLSTAFVVPGKPKRPRQVGEGLPPADAPTGTRSYQYAAAIACGIQPDPQAMLLTQGFYATTINIHNPGYGPVTFRKKLALTFPPREQRPGDVIHIANDALGPDEALKVDCTDLEKRLFPGGFPQRFIQGFVVIQSSASLDVTGVYTTGTLDQRGRITHSSIAVEEVRERRLRGGEQPDEPAGCPDLIVARIDQPQFDAASRGSVIRAVIRNAGMTPAAASIAQLVDPSTPQITGAPYSATANVNPLAPNDSQTVEFRLPYSVYNPVAELEITADYKGTVPECDEGNNRAEFKEAG
jgi:hypothetical protein